MGTPGQGRVIVGIAHTAAGYAALRYATGQARDRGMPLVAVRALSLDVAPGTLEEMRVRLLTSAAGEVSLAFAEAMGALPPGLPVTVRAAIGEPARALLAVATEPDDLLVVGAPRRRRLAFLPRNTVASHCARMATCPVVAVPAAALARASTPQRLAHDLVHDVEKFLRDTHSTVDVAGPDGQ